MRLSRFFLAASAALFIAGCAAPTPKVNLATGTLRAGQTVAIVEPPPIAHYFIYYAHPGIAFGAIGGAIAAAQFHAQASEVAQLLARQGFVPHTEILDAFRRELEGAGFKVAV